MIQVKNMMLIASLILLLSGAAESWHDVTNQNHMVCKPISEVVAPKPTSNCSEHVCRGRDGKSGPRGERGPRGFPGNSPFPEDFNISRFAEMETRLGQLEATNEALEGTVQKLEKKGDWLMRKDRQMKVTNEAQTTKISSLQGTVRQLEGTVRQLEQTVEGLERALRCGFNYDYTAIWTRQSWQESRALCRAMGGDLAVHGMKNPAQIREILTQLNLLSDPRVRSENHIWIGMSDLATEGVWEWLDGSRVDRSSAHWYRGNPSGGTENCGEIFFWSETYGPSLGLLNDNDCHSDGKAICEVKVIPRICTQ